MRRRALLFVMTLVWMAVWVPPAIASYRLERADGSSPTRGLSIPGTLVLADVHWPVVDAPPKPRAVRAAPAAHKAAGPSSGRCGGSLPPCWVMMRESRGDINAYNPTGCSGRGCNGKWQFDPRTGDGTGSEAEQDAEARRVWDNGRGCSHWAAC